MSDELRDRFDAFRTASTAQTRPPGIPAIRRTLARRHAVRAGTFAVAAIAALVIAFVPGHAKTGVGPARPPVPSSTPTPSNSPVATTPQASPSPHVSTHSTPPAPPPKSPGCGPFGAYPVSALVSSDDPDTFTIGAELLARCPTVTLHITRAVYVGTGPSSSKLTLYNSTTHTMTPTARTTTMPSARTPAGTCYTSLTVTVIGTGMPHSISNLVPQLETSGLDDAATQYFYNRGFGLLGTAWSQPAC